MNRKVKEWLDRYTLPSILGTLAAFTVANISKNLFGNIVLSAILATIADFIAGYGTIAYRDIKTKKRIKGKASFVDILKVIRDMLIEFGPAEYIDSFILRPMYFSIFPLWIHNYPLAILLGSLAAEVSYHIPVILSYEARKKIFKD